MNIFVAAIDIDGGLHLNENGEEKYMKWGYNINGDMVNIPTVTCISFDFKMLLIVDVDGCIWLYVSPSREIFGESKDKIKYDRINRCKQYPQQLNIDKLIRNGHIDTSENINLVDLEGNIHTIEIDHEIFDIKRLNNLETFGHNVQYIIKIYPSIYALTIEGIVVDITNGHKISGKAEKIIKMSSCDDRALLMLDSFGKIWAYTIFNERLIQLQAPLAQNIDSNKNNPFYVLYDYDGNLFFGTILYNTVSK